MSLNGHHNQSRHIHRDKRGREIKSEACFLSKRLRHDDGSYRTYRAGKLIAKEDVPTMESKFFKQTPVSTIAEKIGKKDTVGEKESASHVRKRLDVNAKALKL